MYNTRAWNIIGWISFVVVFTTAAVNIYLGLNGGSTSRLVFGVVLVTIGSALLVLKLSSPE
jgi:putative Mn2+ efflux pump MntP